MSLLRRMILMNQGSSTPPEPVLPYDAEVEYLESTGTQYIDTGIIPNNTTGIFAKVYVGNTTDRYFLGGNLGGTGNRWGFGHSSNGFYCGYGALLSSRLKYNNTVLLKLNFLNNREMSMTLFSDQTITQSESLPTLTFSPNLNIRLYCGAHNTNALACRFYSCTITQGNEVVMDLIPVRKSSIGYMYDRISGELLGNNGTGSFVLGSDIN